MSTFDLEQRDKALVQVAKKNQTLFDQQPVSLKDTSANELEDLSINLQEWRDIFEEDLVQIEFCQ